MPLSDDQKALLRLLAQREQGYEDIAALKGKSVAEVRDEVREALAALDAPPPEPAPTPLSAPAPRAKERPQEATAERRRVILFAGGALGVVAIVLAAIALIGGDSNSGADSTADAAAEAAAAVSDKVTQAVLTSPDGGEASGNAIFGRLGKEEIVLQVTAEGLEPTESGETYTVWLYRTPKLTLRIGSVAVGEEGRLAARFPVPAELLAYIAGGAFNQIYVSRTSNAAYQQEVARAKATKSLPRYTGETVLTGEITGPITKAAAQRQGG